MRRFFVLACLLPFTLFAQETALSFQAARQRLLARNLDLLANYYGIDLAEAQLIQARLWNNPYFIYNQELYNVTTNKYFQAQNQYLVQVEQIFSIAGKHTNTVKLARINVAISKSQFQDVLRSLIFDLGITYNQLAAVERKEQLYNEVLGSYARLLEAIRQELQVGVISQTEALRLESEYIAVKAQSVQNYNDKEQTLAHLRVLLQIPSDSAFQTTQSLPPFQNAWRLDSLVAESIRTRPDLKVMQLNQEYQDRNLKLQYSLSVPDVKIGVQPHDQGSNYTRPYSGINLEFPLPVFDRNQGNIRQAQVQIKQTRLQSQLLNLKVRNEVTAAWNQYQKSNEGISNYTPEFLERLQRLNQSIAENFQKRNISLLQFIDQQRIFIQTNIQQIELRQQYLDSVNELNFSVGKQLIEY